MTVKDRLQALGITLPPVAVPAAAYVPFVRSGNLVFISGHIAKQDGKPWVGQLGLTMATEEGQAAARAIAIDLMGTLQAAAGDLDAGQAHRQGAEPGQQHAHLHRAPPGDQRLHASCWCEVFGPEIGAHARSAFGVAQMPMGACVEIELIAELE